MSYPRARPLFPRLAVYIPLLRYFVVFLSLLLSSLFAFPTVLLLRGGNELENHAGQLVVARAAAVEAEGEAAHAQAGLGVVAVDDGGGDGRGRRSVSREVW
ncbi:hypothetical protein ONZ43_g5042 [Nemania bipapillata]|uniref:Uncharacterized protein n=1 Tax=Nemania bipapillata TaxID=110536 RepID=A0ACC2IFE3_9PEZI|nr:hypothetical protein ONZ43_g5042 [Nemania bipapillata]